MAKPKGFWCALYPTDPNTGLQVEILVCSANRPSATTILNDPARIFYPYLETYPTFEISVFEGEFNGQASAKVSNLQISSNNALGQSFCNYVWDGAKVQVWKGDANETSFASLVQLFEGVIDSAPENDGNSATFTTKDKTYLLEENFLSVTYGGTGGIEGPAELLGVFKPVVIGNPLNVRPYLINAPYVIFQYHGGTQECSGLSTVYENGISFGSPAATIAWQGSAAATYTALQSYTLTPGQWVDAPSIGCFRLGGEPKSNGVITCDPIRTSVITLKDTIINLLAAANIGSYDLTSLNALQTNSYNQTVHDYITDQVKVSDLIATYLYHVGGYMFWNTQGVPTFGLVRMGSPSITLRSDGTTTPVVLDAKSNPVSAPFKRLRIGADKVFKVHENSEISDALYQSVNQLNTTLTNLSNTVYEASNDGLLTPEEKIQITIPADAVMANTYTNLTTRATALGITFTALANARTSYLAGRNSLSPAWNNVTASSSLAGVTSPSFRDRVIAYNNELINLNKLVSEKDAQLADWAQVSGSGKPEDNATRNVPRGNYNAATAYVPGDTVVWTVASGGDGNGYVRIGTGTTTGVAPSVTASWALNVERGAVGTTGLSNATVFLYQRSATPPSAPSTTVTYTFATGVATGMNNGWSATVPAGTNPLYTISATASANTATDTIAPAEWTTPVVMVQNGADGLNVSAIQLYRRTATSTAPTVTTTGNATFTFATGGLAGQPAGWTTSIPASSGGAYLWTIFATASAVGATDTIANTEWSAPQLVLQDGATGASGLNVANVFLYQRSVSAPALPSAAITYTFATGAATGITNGWSQTVPTANGQPLYVTVATASSSGATASIAAASWAAVSVLSQDGAAGIPALSAHLTNDSASLPAYADGTVASYSTATGDFKVFYGQTDVSANFTLSTISNPQALTVGYAGRTFTVTGGFDPSEETASFTIRGTGSGAYAGIVLDKVFTLSKSKGGYEIVSALPSTNLFVGRVVFLSADGLLYRYLSSPSPGWYNSTPAATITGTLTNAQLADLDAAKLTGTLSANLIAANTLVASKMVLMDTGNMVSDSAFTDVSDVVGAAYWYRANFVVATSGVDVSALGVDRALRSPSGTGIFNQATDEALVSPKRIPIEPSSPIRCYAQAYVPAGYTGWARLIVRYYKSDGVTPSSINATDVIVANGGSDFRTAGNPSATTLVYDNILNAPSDAAYVRIGVRSDWAPSTLSGGLVSSGYVTYSCPRMMRAASSSLIVDGAVTAAQIDALAVTTAKLAAGAVTAAKVDTTSAVITGTAQIANSVITTAKIADLNVTTAKIADLNVSTLKIADQAVTVPSSAYTAANISCPNAVDTTVQSLTVTTTGAPIVIFINFELTGGSASSGFNIKINRGSTLLETGAYASSGSIFSGFTYIFTDNPTAGTYTYNFTVLPLSPGTYTVRKRFLMTLETKK